MESQPRSLWVFVAVVALVMCLCAAAVTLIGIGAFTLPRVNVGVGTVGGERIERSFDLGAAPAIDIENFAGGVTVQAGDGNAIQVVAVKKALTRSARDQIQVEITEQAGGLLIKTQRPSGLGMGSVDLQVVAPAGTRLKLHTGSGGVKVKGLTGNVAVSTGSGGIELQDVQSVSDAQTGSGGITVRGAAGPTHLQTGSGGIEYEGMPQGDCRFETGSGGIELALPADLSAKVELVTGSGSIALGYQVTGQVNARNVQGTIGRGDLATIYAHTGSGSIELKQK